MVLYNEVIDLLPGSPQGQRAQAALKRRQGKEAKEPEA